MIKKLIEMNKGQKGRVVAIRGGRGKILRLAEMGITPGEEVILLQKSLGPVIIKVKDTNLALGKGLAESILVEVGENGKN
ncbi:MULTISPECIES: FeoA family protein [Dictyoglomus]|uniref:FeoA family protein n=1 Tax=Dictyoglomus turgidum (strain DSM 6724 / Z-1310) TaxID=515635 RepID=B8E2J8_DICTD|nr:MULTISPECIES: FeoA family protein [Dictyoglomus]ACK42842.1 FeoA family protein [Dictyoglomus turgidum DSM 6724]HBU30901.1 ferrous iron transport protein A [Dictyoglomus sp.]